MRTGRTLSITLPPEILERAEQIARKERRTMSELVGDALAHYERAQWWAAMNAYGRPRAERLGLSEGDVVSVVKQVRKRRSASKSKTPALQEPDRCRHQRLHLSTRFSGQGDLDLLSLKRYEDIEIITPATFLKRFAPSPR